MKTTIVKLEDSVGKVLSHDVTRITKAGKFKGTLFKRGHLIQKKDIPKLSKIGREHIYVLELGSDELQEEDGAIKLASLITGINLRKAKPTEGNVAIISNIDGILKIDVKRLEKINEIEGLGVATQHKDRLVNSGEKVAVAKVFPLTIKKEQIKRAAEICEHAGPIINVLPLKKMDIGLIITGNEVYHGLIKDEFGPVMKKKIKKLGSAVRRIVFAPDEPKQIVDEILELQNEGVDLIIATGGMAVDPDDVTLRSALEAKANIEKYGAPVQPGFMFMISYLNDTPLLGIPACAMFYDTTILDLVLPRILAGEKLTHKDIISLAHGGLCLKCNKCTFPICPFGRG